MVCSPLASLLFVLATAAVPPPGAAPEAKATLACTGAAATEPLWRRWFSEYAHVHALSASFESRSGPAGVSAVATGLAQLAGETSALTDAELAATATLVDVPVAVSAVAVVYGVLTAGDLHLTPEVVAGLFAGRITRWRDPAIAALNPGITIPDLPVAVFAQPVDAGDTATFVDWLSRSGNPIARFAGRTLPDSHAVLEAMKKTEGAIAFLDAAQARRGDLFIASIRNRDGWFVQPSMRSVSHAAVGVRMLDDFRASIVDAQGVEAYPIASFTYAVIDSAKNAGTRRELIDFLRWVLHEGQQHVVSLGYAPLPGLLVRTIDARLARLAPR